MTGALRSLYSTIHSLGWSDGLACLLAKSLERISFGRVRLIKYRLMVQPITEGIGLASHRGRGFEVREVGVADPLLERMGHISGAVEPRFRQGAHCLVALKKGEICGFLWWTEGVYDEDEVRCLFVPMPHGRSVWDFDVYVYPSHRFGAAFCSLWDATNRLLYARGFRNTCSRISAFNRPSFEAHRRLGAKVVGTRWYLCLGSVQFSLSKGRPRLHMSLSPESVPIVEVSPIDEQQGVEE